MPSKTDCHQSGIEVSKRFLLKFQGEPSFGLTVGTTWGNFNGSFRVTDVDPNLAAARCGIHMGDELVGMNIEWLDGGDYNKWTQNTLSELEALAPLQLVMVAKIARSTVRDEEYTKRTELILQLAERSKDLDQENKKRDLMAVVLVYDESNMKKLVNNRDAKHALPLENRGNLTASALVGMMEDESLCANTDSDIKMKRMNEAREHEGGSFTNAIVLDETDDEEKSADLSPKPIRRESCSNPFKRQRTGTDEKIEHCNNELEGHKLHQLLDEARKQVAKMSCKLENLSSRDSSGSLLMYAKPDDLDPRIMQKTVEIKATLERILRLKTISSPTSCNSTIAADLDYIMTNLKRLEVHLNGSVSVDQCVAVMSPTLASFSTQNCQQEKEHEYRQQIVDWKCKLVLVEATLKTLLMENEDRSVTSHTIEALKVLNDLVQSLSNASVDVDTLALHNEDEIRLVIARLCGTFYELEARRRQELSNGSQAKGQAVVKPTKIIPGRVDSTEAEIIDLASDDENDFESLEAVASNKNTVAERRDVKATEQSTRSQMRLCENMTSERAEILETNEIEGTFERLFATTNVQLDNQASSAVSASDQPDQSLNMCSSTDVKYWKGLASELILKRT